MSAPLSLPGTRGILAAVDGSPASNCAVDWAAREAAMHGVALRIVHVMRPLQITAPGVSIPVGLGAWREEQARLAIDDAVRIAAESTRYGTPSRIDGEVLFGPTVPTLVELSANAQMIVVGSRGLGAVARTLLGSVSSSLIHRSHCPVAVVHDEDPLMPNPAGAPVLVGIDGSPASELATAIAFDEASRRGVELVALHVFSDVEVSDFPASDWPAMKPVADQTLAERLAGWQERYPDVVVRREVEHDRPTLHLVQRSEAAQLVVVGSHGRGGFTGMLLGSVSAAVVQAARMPVIVARGSGALQAH